MAAGSFAFWGWVGLAILIAGGALLAPIVRRRSGPASGGGGEDFDFLTSQLEELQRDLDRGLISQEQHGLVEAEIARRVLARERQSISVSSGSTDGAVKSGKWLAVGLALSAPVGAVFLYLMVGSPGFPSQPFATRTDEPAREVRALTELAETLDQRLVDAPSDRETLIALAETRSRLEDFSGAQDAYRRAIALSQDDRDLRGSLLAAFAETFVLAGEGRVSDQAVVAIEESLRLTPREPRARYYLGIARLDAGDRAEALRIWQSLAADSLADAPWLPNLRARIAGLEAEIGGGAPIIDEQARAAMMSLSDEERAERIGGMVEGLQARLEQAPEDLDGWLRLATAYGVMGRQGEAIEALGRAAGQVGEDLAAMDAVLRGYFSAAPDAMTGVALPEESVILAGRLYAIDQDHRAALWVLAEASRTSGDNAAARGFLKLLLKQLPEGLPEYENVLRQLDALEE